MAVDQNTGKCVDVQPTGSIEGAGRYSYCPQCGRDLAILSSGYFRAHAPRLKPGNPKIAEALATLK